ncbi:MAG TPA: hypothetical protein VM686_37300 [Polyangiaceae bacterium]|nr:hypothetical protein [Polyangiaceae bacterium]
MENSLALRAVILAMEDWFGPPRLARTLRQAGFHVTGLSYRGFLLASADVDAAVYLPDEQSDDELLGTLKKQLLELRPSMVVPGDDLSVEVLQVLAADAELAAVLCDSLGDPRHHPTLRSRKALATLARDAGVRQPVHASVHSLEQALAFTKEHGLPAVFKAEESCAGFGVSICKDEAAVRTTFAQLESREPRTLKEGLLAQGFVEGKTAMRAIIAWRGELLAGISAIKVETHPRSTGPSAVVEVIDHAEMADTSTKLVKALGFSGFASFDFQLDSAGAAHLIELNARPTPICHLGHHFDSDLGQALKRALSGEPAAPGAPRGVPRKVALFPQEWIRRQDSPHFADALLDVPWDEAQLLGGLVQTGLKQIGWKAFRRADERRERLRARLDGLEARGKT